MTDPTTGGDGTYGSADRCPGPFRAPPLDELLALGKAMAAERDRGDFPHGHMIALYPPGAAVEARRPLTPTEHYAVVAGLVDIFEAAGWSGTHYGGAAPRIEFEGTLLAGRRRAVVPDLGPGAACVMLLWMHDPPPAPAWPAPSLLDRIDPDRNELRPFFWASHRYR